MMYTYIYVNEEVMNGEAWQTFSWAKIEMNSKFQAPYIFQSKSQHHLKCT